MKQILCKDMTLSFEDIGIIIKAFFRASYKRRRHTMANILIVEDDKNMQEIWQGK